MKKVIVLFPLLVAVLLGVAQNVAITDDNIYTANSSAMLDVKSLTKGFLVPRMTTTQRNAIVTPATGLLIFDTTENGFYYYDGSVWVNLSSGSSGGLFWSYNSPNIYMTNSTDKLGLGTSSPLHKLHLYENVATTDGTDGNFIDIQNPNNFHGVMGGIRFQNGSTVNTFKGGIFYQDIGSYGTGNLILANNTSVNATNVSATDGRLVLQNDGRVMVKGDPNGGINDAIFAVQNSNGDTVFAVYPEGVRIWVNDAGGTKANGSRGGFAVGGFSPTKLGFTNEYLRVTPDSVRIYIDDTYVPAKANGSRGGFAVGGFSPVKGTITDHYLFVQDDSTRVYVADSMQGFGVENIQAANDQRIMRLTTQNYFIGHESGVKNTTGAYNSFLGYNAGFNNSVGNENVFFGYKSGYSNTGGDENIYIGNFAGYNNVGSQNIMIGTDAGKATTNGSFNVYIGTRSGWKTNPSSGGNTFVGNQSGANTTIAAYGTYLGWYAGGSADGEYNTYVGTFASWDNYDGARNVAVGAFAGGNIGSNNVVLGYNAEAGGSGNVVIGYNTTVSGSDRLAINNSNTTPALIYGEFDTDRIGINDNAPSANLHIKQVGVGEEGLAIENDGTTSTWSWEISTNWLNLAFNGTTVGHWDNTTGNYVATSDKRLKKDIEVLNESLLSKVMQLKVVNYRLKHADENSRKVIGFIAQDVQKIFPEIVHYNKEESEYLGLNYDDFGIISIKAIQEQQQVIRGQEEKINELELQIKALNKEIENIKSLLNSNMKK